MPNSNLMNVINFIQNEENSQNLNEMKKSIEKRLDALKAQDLKDYLKKGQELASLYGFDIDSLQTEMKKGKSLTAKTKYMNPENSEEKWSGRGKQPNWVTTWLEQHQDKTLEDLLIK